MALIPSNIETERVFQLTIAAVLQRPAVLGEPTQSATFVIDYSDIDSKGYFITLEGDVLGTVTESGASKSLFPNSVFTLDIINKLLTLTLQWDETWVLEDCPSKTYLFNITINDASKSNCTIYNDWTYLKCMVNLEYSDAGKYTISSIGTTEANLSSCYKTDYVGYSKITWDIGPNINSPTVYFRYGEITSPTLMGNDNAGWEIAEIVINNTSSTKQKIGFYNSAGEIIPCCGGTDTNGCTGLKNSPVSVNGNSSITVTIQVGGTGMLEVR